MIKNKFLTILILYSLILLSCKEEEEKVIDYAVLSGNVDNSNGGNIVLVHTRTHSLDTLNIENGSFHDTINVEAGHYYLRHDRSMQQIYLKPGFELNTSFDAEKFDSTLTFSGTAARINNYLLKKSRKQKDFMGERRTTYGLSEKDFKQKVTEQKNLLVKMLESSNLPKNFKKREERNIHYAYITDLINYGYYNSRHSENSTHDYEPSEAFQAEINEVDYENVEDYLFSGDYRNLVSNHFSEEAKILEKGIAFQEV